MWEIPEGGLTESIDVPSVVLKGKSQTSNGLFFLLSHVIPFDVFFHLTCLIDFVSFYFIDLPGHQDKPNIVKYHPSAIGVLASAALDLTVKIWDISQAKALITLTDHTEQVGPLFNLHTMFT